MCVCAVALILHGFFKCDRMISLTLPLVLLGMLPTAPNVHRDAYIVACGRVMRDVMGVVGIRGCVVSVEVDPGRAYRGVAEFHKIHLTYRRVTRVLSVDHQTFMSPEFFRARVLHQVEEAIKELTWGK
jgi:hypothetical protein